MLCVDREKMNSYIIYSKLYMGFYRAKVVDPPIPFNIPVFPLSTVTSLGY